MDAEYYKKIGFKCGLEIHQRLSTKEKLFCSCDAGMPKDYIIDSVDRMQRAVAGETGSIDRATAFESMKRRKFVYSIFDKSTCLVDIDEEPPHSLNPEALDIALEIAVALHAKLPDEIEPMRKEVVDGSDPSAFQRTMLIGYDGFIEVGKRQIAISSIFLEEESSGIEESSGSQVIYNTDRLGIPLIEIDTPPDIATPEEAKAVAMQIGLLLRLSGRVQRGIGSIRQDVNISISDGARVEIKGFQELETMDKVIEAEILRQTKLIEIRKELLKRKAAVERPKDVTKMFSNTKVGILSKAIDNGGSVYAARLRGFAGLLGIEISPHRRLGSEISDYAKMAGVGGIIHSDEDLEGYGFSAGEKTALKEVLGTNDGDAFIIVAGSKTECRSATELAVHRAELALEGVPLETRAVDQKNVSTKFLRPLPGGSRMYPETDALPVEVAERMQTEAEKAAGAVDIKKAMDKLEKEIGKQLAEQMIWSPRLQSYYYIIGNSKAPKALVASVLLGRMTEIRRLGFDVDQIGNDTLLRIFEDYAEGKITKAAIDEVLKALPKEPNDVDRIIKDKGLEKIGGKKLEEIVKKFASKGRDKKFLVGEIMAKYRLNIDGEELNKILKNFG